MRRAYFESAGPTADLNRRSLKGGLVSVMAQGSNMAVQVVSTIVLARLLLPEDFGLVAMVAALTGFATVFVDLGTRDAVAQRGDVSEVEVSTLFWITLGVGVAFALATMLAGPWIARFYGEPRLEAIAMAFSLTFVLPALYSQQYALMRRALMFQRLAAIDVGANVAATIVAIILALGGFAYWALVTKPVLTALFTAVCVWSSCGWWPGRPAFTAGVRDLLKFGLNITGFTMADFVARSADRVALGYTAGPKELGYYQNAFVVYDHPLALFTVPLHVVAVSTLTRLRDSPVELRRAWSTALSSLTYFAAPAFVLLAVTGEDLVVLLLGSKWAQAGTILSILALRGPAHVVERTLGWLHVAAGRADRWRQWGLLSCGVLLIALFCGLPFGAVGIAASYTIFMYLLFVPAILYAGRPLGLTALDLYRTVGPQLITSLIVAALGFALRLTVFDGVSAILRLLGLSFVCALAYLAIMVLGFRSTEPLRLAASIVRRKVITHG